MSIQPKALSIYSNGIMRQIRSEVTIKSNGALSGSSCKAENLQAVWDTGAMTTCISARVAQDLNLKSIGRATLKGIDGSTIKNIYIVDIKLLNDVEFLNVRVYEGEFDDFDVLIGMDMITSGDFSISNFQGKTTVTFRIPSLSVTDYEKQLKVQKITGTHGKGQRKKKH